MPNEPLVGMIGMGCGELSRFSECYASLVNLHRPDRTIFLQCRGMSIANNWNVIGKEFLRSPAEWLFLVNDDHVYPEETLIKLLADDKDIITGLYLSRSFPYMPLLFDHIDAEGLIHQRFLYDHEQGVIPIKACGDGALLIKRKVLETIPFPWWELGTIESDKCSHDVTFSKKVMTAGFQMYCDLDVQVGHHTVVTVMPQRTEEGPWQTLLLQGANAIMIPTPQYTPRIVPPPGLLVPRR